MNFAKPEWLLCLTALPLIGFMAWLAWRKRRYRWERMIAHRLRGRLSHTRSPSIHFASLGLALAGVAGLIIGVAQPESGEEWIEVENEGRNILFCVDISRSMLARDIEPNRLLASRAAALEILERFPEDRVGVLLFSGETLVQSPLTIDHSFVEQTLAQLDPNDIPVGGSNLTTAIDSGTRLLKETGQQSNIMVVFSDGEKSSEGLKEAAAGAAREGIFIYAMGMGTREGSFIPDPRESDGKFRDRSGKVVFSKLNEEALQVIAEETNGYYSEGMGAGFIGKLDSALAEMDRFQEEGKHQRVAKPAHRWFVFGGLLLIMASIFIKCLPLTPTVVLVAFIFATPRTEASLVEDGIAALKAGETTTAQQLFSEAARDSKGDHAASLYLASGSAASRAQDWSTAVASFSSALLAEDSEILQQAHYALATSLFYLGVSKAKEEKVKAWEGSIEHFKASLKIDAENEASRENLESVEKKLAELQEEKPEEEKKQDKENQKKQDSEKSDPKEETENDKSSEGTSDESEDEQSNQKSEKEDNPSEEDGEQNQTNKPKDGESENIQQSDKSKANDKQPNQDQSNEGKANQPNRNKTQAENSNLKDDPNAPKNETPRERARRLLKQYSDFGGKAPRRIRRPYNRSPHDW